MINFLKISKKSVTLAQPFVIIMSFIKQQVLFIINGE